MPFYAVARGRQTGIFRTWRECEAATRAFSRAAFKKFDSQAEAQAFLDAHAAAERGDSSTEADSTSAGAQIDAEADSDEEVSISSFRSVDSLITALLMHAPLLFPLLSSLFLSSPLFFLSSISFSLPVFCSPLQPGVGCVLRRRSARQRFTSSARRRRSVLAGVESVAPRARSADKCAGRATGGVSRAAARRAGAATARAGRFGLCT